MTDPELRRAALRLDPSSRARLAQELLDSLDALSDVEIEKLWLAEAARRDAALDSGPSSFSAADVLARARDRRR